MSRAARGPAALLLIVALAVCLVACLGACSSPSTTGPTAPDDGASVPEGADTARLERALMLLQAAQRYAFTVTTWEIGPEGGQLLVETSGVKVAPWTSLHIHAVLSDRTADIVYSEKGAAGRVTGEAWSGAGALMDSAVWLQELPLESEFVDKSLIPTVTATAAVVDPEAPIPEPYPPAPTHAAEAYSWSNPLMTGPRVDAQVATTAWLNQAGWILRFDRETTPVSAQSGLRHTYTVIVFSRQGDSTLTLPVNDFEDAVE